MTGFPSDGGVILSLTSTTALGLSAVWRCLDILGNGVSQLAWDERRGNASLPLSRLVKRPLEAATRRDWVGYVVSSLALYDVAYLWKVGGEDAEAPGGIAINSNGRLQAAVLLVAGDVAQLRQGAQLVH